MIIKSPFKSKCVDISVHTQQNNKSLATITNNKLGTTNVQNNLNAVGDEMPELNENACVYTPGPNCNDSTLAIGGVKKLLYTVNINNNNYYIRTSSFYDAASNIYSKYKTRNKSNLITVSKGNKSILFNGLNNRNIKYLYKE